METDQILRDYGFVPGMISTSQGTVRCSMPTGSLIGQWIAFGLIGLAPIPFWIVGFAFAPDPFTQVTMVFLCFAQLWVCHLIAHDVNQWVELDGRTFRWKHGFTGIINERDIGDIDGIKTLTLTYRTVVVKIVEHLLGRIKGFEFQFFDMKQGVRIFRADPQMTNVAELLEAVVKEMSKYGHLELETEIFEQAPLIRRLVLVRDRNPALTDQISNNRG